MAGALWEYEIRRVRIEFDGLGGVQEEVDCVVDGTPERHASEPDEDEGEPCWRDQRGEVGQRGEGVRAVQAAHDGLGAGLDEGRGRDGEFAHAQPAEAAVDAGGDGGVGDGTYLAGNSS